MIGSIQFAIVELTLFFIKKYIEYIDIYILKSKVFSLNQCKQNDFVSSRFGGENL